MHPERNPCINVEICVLLTLWNSNTTDVSLPKIIWQCFSVTVSMWRSLESVINNIIGLWVESLQKPYSKLPRGSTPDFKWQVWSNGGKNQNPKKSLDQNLTPKKSHAEYFLAIRIYSRNYMTGIRSNYHKSSDCFEYPKKSLLKSSYPPNYLSNFSTLKKSHNWKFQTPKILQSSLLLEIRTTHPGVN